MALVLAFLVGLVVTVLVIVGWMNNPIRSGTWQTAFAEAGTLGAILMMLVYVVFR